MQEFGTRYVLFSGSLYGFGAVGLLSHFSTIFFHFSITFEGNVPENLSNTSVCFSFISTASSKRFANRVPFEEVQQKSKRKENGSRTY
jgi:hypothetical protein